MNSIFKIIYSYTKIRSGGGPVSTSVITHLSVQSSTSRLCAKLNYLLIFTKISIEFFFIYVTALSRL